MEKCSLIAFAKSVVLFIETPFKISSLIEEMLLLRDVSSFVVCQVRRESFLCSVLKLLFAIKFLCDPDVTQARIQTGFRHRLRKRSDF